MREVRESCRGKKGVFLPDLPSNKQIRQSTKFSIRIDERPQYHRFNAKTKPAID
jgi:hypothetical protein